MKVILMERLANLGGVGDEVAVKDGYGRNYLLPSGAAVRCTPENQKMVMHRRKELERAALQRMELADRVLEQCSSVELVISARALASGRLYGSIGAREIATEAKAQGIDLVPQMIRMPSGPIRAIGDAEGIEVVPHPERSVTIKVSVTAL